MYERAGDTSTRPPEADVIRFRRSTRESYNLYGLPILASDKRRAKQVLLTRGGHLYSKQMDKNTPLCRGKIVQEVQSL